MIGALLGRQLRHMRWILIGLALGLAAFEVFIIHLAEAFDAGPGIQQFLDMMPQIIHDLVNSQIAAQTFPAFVAFGFMHPAAMVGCTALIVLLATSPAGERDTGLLDLLLARPLPRTTYLTATVVGIVLVAVILPACMLAGCALGLSLVDVPDELPWTDYGMAATQLAALLMAIGGFAMLVAVISQRRGTAIARILAVLLLAYVLDTMAKVFTALAPLQWLTPFHYFDPMGAVLDFDPLGTTADGRISPLGNLGILLVLAIGTTALAYRSYRARDL
jgi:ABC-2 type transport system permease protein